MIGIDAIFTPIKSAYYDVSNVRVGQLTNFNKLEVNIETDGTIAGQEAFDIAAHILVDHFSMVYATDFIAQETPAAEAVPLAMDVPATGEENEIEKTTLSTRAKNALTKNGVTSIMALQNLSSGDISNIEGLGEKTIKEILEFLNR